MTVPIECWPFFDDSSGHNIEEQKFYGFCDCGGLVGKSEGYTSRDEALLDIRCEYGHDLSIATKKEELGGFAVAVLSGREFVDQLYFLTEGNGGAELSDFGHWSKN